MNEPSPIREIPFGDGEAPGLDPITGANQLFVNASLRGRAVTTRPGIRAWDGFPSNPASTAPVVAMAILQGTVIYVTDDGLGTRKVYACTPAGNVVDASPTSDRYLGGTAPPRIAVWRNLAIITGGATPLAVTLSLVADPITGAPNASDVCMISQYAVLVEEGRSGLFYWSGVGEDAFGTYDTTFDFREAEAQPDPIKACLATSRELYLFGDATLQIFYPDPDETFTPGTVLDTGCLSGPSVVRYDGRAGWLNHQARFLLTDGHGDLGPEAYISSPAIDRTLKTFGTLTDCWGYREIIGAHDSLVWSFPTEGRCFAYDVNAQKWGERRRLSRGRWVAWAPRSYLYWPERGIHLVGMPDGTIAELTEDAHDDLGDPIKVVLRTGVIRDTKITHTEQVQLVMARGAATTDAAVELSWRDDGGRWKRPLRRTLGRPGDGNPVVVVSPVGAPHRTREYELSFSGADRLVLAEANETLSTGDF